MKKKNKYIQKIKGRNGREKKKSRNEFFQKKKKRVTLIILF